MRAAEPGQGRMARVGIANGPAEQTGAPVRNLTPADQCDELVNPCARRKRQVRRRSDRNARPYSSERWTSVMSIQRSNLLAALRRVPTVSKPSFACSSSPERLSVATVATIVL